LKMLHNEDVYNFGRMYPKHVELRILTYLLTYLFTYLLTPWSRVLLEKLNGSAASQEIPRTLWNPKVHHHKITTATG